MIVFSRLPGRRRRAGDVSTSSSGADALRWPRKTTLRAALQALRLGAWSAVMWAHHKGRATTSEEPERPPEGSLFAATGGRRRRLTMSRHRRRDASYPVAVKRRSYVLPSYESKYLARNAR